MSSKLFPVIIAVFLSLAAQGINKSIPDAIESVHCTQMVSLTSEYPHNEKSFTQGLFFYDGKMYESTGRYGESMLYKNIDVETGKAEAEYIFPEDIFAEGSVVYKDKLYVLTYKENKVFVFNPERLELLNTVFYPRQGWGLTTDGEYLIASDGTSELYYMDENLDVIKNVTVKRNGAALENINELEYIGGEIWANIWLTDEIVIINPENGNVKKTVDFSGIYKPQTDDSNAVLNGIAYNEDNGYIYITGKLWGKLFEFELK